MNNIRVMKNGLGILLGIVLVGLFFGCRTSVKKLQEPTMPEKKINTFQMMPTILVKQKGKAISTGTFHPQKWYPAKVPSTVLRILVENGVYPSPYIGMNNMKIPDASDVFNRKYGLSKYSYLPDKENPWKTPYWYRSTFQLPHSFEAKHIWITFKGINYKADVWLNGRQVADSSHMKGMFRSFSYDITQEAKVGQDNYLAVKIYPVDHPGEPAEPQLKAFGPFGSNGGADGAIGKDVTMLCSIGWDWIPAVRDREMGIWEGVSVHATGSVKMTKPHVLTKLPLPDLNKAKLTIQTKLENLVDHMESGTLNVSISPHNFRGKIIHISKIIRLNPRQKDTVVFSPENVRKLLIDKPHLWWPNTYGPQNLYDLTMNFKTGEGISDQQKVTFGIRQISSKIEYVGKFPRRDFYVNGRKIHLAGGAWVPDLLLHKTVRHYQEELKLWKTANLNLVRVWGGGIAPPDAFFRACDEDGLLVWQDFWITGDTNGLFGGSKDWPLDSKLFLANIKNTIKRIRNHPSLLVWTGGNEMYPKKDIYEGIRKAVAQLDGTRPFLPSSSGNTQPPESWKLSWPDNGPAGTYSGGPYYWVQPQTYYQLADTNKYWVFKNEVGLPSVPSMDVLKRFIPDYKPDSAVPYPLNNTWGYHDACEGNGKYSYYDGAIRKEYGKPKSLADYVEKAQMINAVNYRAIFESVNKNMSHNSGVLLWKVNSSWPSVMWQLYDWYLRPNAGYYYTKKACEPLHIQFNYDDHYITVVNKQNKTDEHLQISADVYDINMNMIDKQFRKTTIGPDRAKEIFNVLPTQKSGIYFIDLNLRNEVGKIISHNFYWFSPDHDYKKLMTLEKTQLSVTRYIEIKNSQEQVYINFRNQTGKLAFFINPEIIDDSTKQEVLPCYWSDNYFSLLPHSQKTVVVSFGKNDVKGNKPYLLIKGVNITPEKIPL